MRDTYGRYGSFEGRKEEMLARGCREYVDDIVIGTFGKYFKLQIFHICKQRYTEYRDSIAGSIDLASGVCNLCHEEVPGDVMFGLKILEFNS
jgi:hypothetical protein